MLDCRPDITARRGVAGGQAGRHGCGRAVTAAGGPTRQPERTKTADPGRPGTTSKRILIHKVITITLARSILRVNKVKTKLCFGLCAT